MIDFLQTVSNTDWTPWTLSPNQLGYPAAIGYLVYAVLQKFEVRFHLDLSADKLGFSFSLRRKGRTSNE
ncbi:hypothetical protein [Paenibacillus sp. DMB5]|uniref:hypothetical protein n=1 Tax=Paenibacillus sp. DMB5 TaxID=1780103 RepID=UPI00076BF79D|nr:hypothetical protein [Paenibacillus sp. DMB5]KUP26184.1 hypothetical protein AWJ19_25715 [Paenibacillus sp. DMB5]KUP26196.1 hypothetical protein AWJ19_25775 [Paenibacillus sp. DMB5]KUP26208.1 hypothetical protein AWJ19_25835 [Paenibacillus sp. DMB5]